MDPKVASRYAKTVALAERPGTDGERKAARAAQVRILNAHPEILAGHPLAQAVGHRDEILAGLRASWDRIEGWTTCTYELAWLLAFDHKELLGALRQLRAEYSVGWVRGVFVLDLDLRFFNCCEYMLEEAFKASARAEQYTEEEIRAALRAPFNAGEFTREELEAMSSARVTRVAA